MTRNRPVSIYLILDDAECPRYVGRSFHPNRRPLDHLRKYPEWAKTFRVLELVSSNVRWQERERYWIAYYRRFANLENIARGGGSAGPKSPDTIRRQREKLLGRRRSPEVIAKIKEALRRRTPEQRTAIASKISLAKKGKSPYLSESERLRRSLALKGNAFMKGRRHSEETRKRIGEKSKGHPPNRGSFSADKPPLPRTLEWIEKIRVANLGKRHSEETKAKIRQKRALQDMSSRRKTK